MRKTIVKASIQLLVNTFINLAKALFFFAFLLLASLFYKISILGTLIFNCHLATILLF